MELYTNDDKDCKVTAIVSATSNNTEILLNFNSSSDDESRYSNILRYGLYEDGEFVRCIECDKQLSEKSDEIDKLKEHLYIEHSDILSRSQYKFFTERHKSDTISTEEMTVTEEEQVASYEVAKIIARNTQPYTLGESVILPAYKNIIESVIGNAALTKISNLRLSTDSISRCMENMSSDIQIQLRKKLINIKFSIQMDVFNNGRIVSNIRYLDEGAIVEHFLSFTEFSAAMSASDVYNSLTKMLAENNLYWKDCVSLCTDNLLANAEAFKNFISVLKYNFPHLQFTYCLPRRGYPMGICSTKELMNVMDSIISMLRYFKTRTSCTNVLKIMCREVGPAQESAILHTYTFWMFIGKTLTRFYEQKEKLLEIFNEEMPKFADLLKDNAWCSKFAYLADISEHLNNLRTSVPRTEDNIFTRNDKLVGFINKIALWKRKIKRNDFTMFPLTAATNPKVISDTILKHLSALEEELPHYFPPFNVSDYDWVQNPFAVTTDDTQHLHIKAAEELAELRAYKKFQLMFRRTTLLEFWNNVQAYFPVLAEDAVTALLHFSSTSLLELEYSTFVSILHKQDGQLCPIEDELRVCLSTIKPRIEVLCKTRQLELSPESLKEKKGNDIA